MPWQAFVKLCLAASIASTPNKRILKSSESELPAQGQQSRRVVGIQVKYYIKILTSTKKFKIW